MQHLSLSQRVKLTFFAGFTLFALVSLAVIFAVTKNLEDYIFERQLSTLVEQYQSAYTQGKPLKLNDNFSLYQQGDALPKAYLKTLENWPEMPAGIGEIDHPDDRDYHYAVSFFANKAWLFIYDVNQLELSEEIEQLFLHFIWFGFASLVIAYFLFFQLVLKRSLAPMYQLIEQVKQHAQHPEQTYQNHYAYHDNERGLLNQTIADYAVRTAQFIKREQAFSQFASHELRTPVTIIKGATELLKLSEKNAPHLAKPIARIECATKQMEDMISVLLNLARERKNTLTEHAYYQETLIEVVELMQEPLQKAHKKLVVAGQLSAELMG
ncbi:HAMP domain-containing histidine kinase [Catenovulum sp. SM1970]|uniref:sensor histidine kinase n=1 Tax=Marinifaba aquimaris TaxID=2741323 RepID=UPI00157377ED|nr:HAMP domain-containing histidine kinase [Marinifaba aquimaris]NTS75813.1 HAMP domain-containing histidine kinase [Marinifaba aquimaris]